MDNINTAATEWEKGNNLKIFKGKSSSAEELEKEWQDFESEMTPDQQLKSDDESIRLYGKTNLERFKDLHDKLSKSDSVDEAYGFYPEEDDDDEVEFILNDETKDKIEQAKQYMSDMNTYIIYPTETLDELEDLHRDMHDNVTPEDIINNDTKTIELFGYSNEDLYNKLKNEFLKAEFDMEDGLNNITIENMISNLNSDTITDIITEYTNLCNMNSNSPDIISATNEAINKMSDKLGSLLEYTPMVSLNPVMGMHPMPMYLPMTYNLKKNDFVTTNPHIDSVFRFNKFFDGVFQGMSMDENIVSVQYEWYDTVKLLQSEYKALRKDDIMGTQLRENIFSLGWHPDYDITKVENWQSINQNILKQVKDRYYGDNKIVNICEIIDLIDGIEDNINAKREKRKNLNPVYIALSAGTATTSQIIKWWTKGPFSHAALGLNYDLKTLYSYNNAGGEHQGLSKEGLSYYEPDQRVAVYCLFIDDEDMIALRKNIEFYLNNKDKTHYSKLNIVSLVFNKPINYQYDMICSQFVDRLLKFLNIDVTGKDSSLVSPNDFYRAAAMNKRIYKLFDGKIKNYKPDRVKRAVDRLLYSDKTKYFKELALLLTEAKGKILKHKQATTPHTVTNQIYRTKQDDINTVSLPSDDYNKAIQQHSFEYTADDIKEFERMLNIDESEPQELIDEYNNWAGIEIAKKLDLITIDNKTEFLKKLDEYKANNKIDQTGANYIKAMRDDFWTLCNLDSNTMEILEILRNDYIFKVKTTDSKGKKLTEEQIANRIRIELQFRVNYNKKMLNDFKRLITENYNLLKMTEEEARQIQDMFDSDVTEDQYNAIVQIKEKLDQNSDAFIVNPNVYDLRKIKLGKNKHAGVICISKDGVDKKFESLSRMIQKALEWDVVIYAHGNTHPNIKGLREYRESMDIIMLDRIKTYAKKFKDYDRYIEQYMSDYGSNKHYAEEIYNAVYHELFVVNVKAGKTEIYDNAGISEIAAAVLIEDRPKTIEEIELSLQRAGDKALQHLTKIIYIKVLGGTEAPNKDFEIAMKIAIQDFIQPVLIYDCQITALDNYLTNYSDWMWTVQPIYSTKAGPFTTMNELLRQLINKEGFRKILIMACNPGGHKLPDDIINTPNVVIKYGDSVGLTEGDDMAKTFNDCLDSINKAEANLISECTKYDIDYNNDNYLLECYNDLDKNIEIVEEKKNEPNIAWKDISGFIKKIMGGLTWIFKQTLNFFKFVINKMKTFFSNIINRDKFVRPVKAKFIHVDKKNKAKLKTTKVSSYKELEKEAASACDSITNAVERYNSDNMKVYNRLGKYAIKMSNKQVNESFFINEESKDINVMPVGDRYDEVWKLLNSLSNKDKEFLALDNPIKQKEIHKALNKNNKNAFIMCDNNGNIVAYFRESLDTNDYHILEDLVVFPKYRGKGYGKEIMKQFSNTFDKAYVKCKPDNEPMINLLIKYGFKCQYEKWDKVESTGDYIWTKDDKLSRQDTAEYILNQLSKSVVTEAKQFPVQFDNDGNLLIKNYKKMDFNKEYQHSHELLKAYDKAKSYEGMKYELARLWFVNTVITAEIYENKQLAPDDKKEYMKIRAWIMNDFTKYNKIYSATDKGFNFSEYYNTTPFSDVYIQINSSTLKFLANLLKVFKK